jgi:cystathionine gamma-synthase
MAATHALITTVAEAGAHVVLPDDLYGGTYRLVDKVLSRWGLEYTMVDQTDLEAVERAVRDDTALIWVETPTNPTLKVIDIEAIVALKRHAFVAVDNTFATPFYQRPLELGADAVVHSVTKYIGGHSDLVGGAIVTDDHDLIERLTFLTNAVGAVPSAMDSYLALRGLRTLGVRMRRHCENAQRVAEFLGAHEMVNHVDYPGLPDDPNHSIAARQMDGFGGMVSFRVSSPERALDVVSRTRVFVLAESLGGVESLIEVPSPMTHASVAGSPLEVSPDLIRLSVGLEDPEDLVADLDQALRG